MELLADQLSPGDIALADQAFMAGIMSLMPALVGLPISEIIAPLGLSTQVRQALCEGSGQIGSLLHIAEFSENDDLSRLDQALAELPGLTPGTINHAQTQALQWANQIGQANPKT